MSIPHLGEILSTLAALVWAFSVVLFRLSGRQVGPLALNFFKNTVAMILLLATLPFLPEALHWRAPAVDYALLVASGVVGIALADTIFLRSLNVIGAGLSQVVNCSYSPFVILFTFFLLGERLTVGDALGAALILGSILFSTAHAPPDGVSRQDLRKGIGLSTLSMALMALGVTLAKPVLDRSPILWATTIRLAGGLGALAAIGLAVPQYRKIWASLRPSRAWRVTIPASVLGTYVAMIIWIAGMKFTQASTAAILNQSSAVFVLPVAALVLKEAITARKLIAVAMAITGLVLVTLA